MKKWLTLMFALVTMLGFSVDAQADEILFRDIPWGSNVETTLNMLPSYSTLYGSDLATRIDSWKSCNANYGKSKNGETPTVYYYGDLMVAGYKVNSITFQFLYAVDENGIVQRDQDRLSLKGAMYRLEVADIKATASDLIEKLTKLYGDGKRDTSEINNPTVTWYGDSNTGVCLEYSDEDVVIWYGNTDETIVDELDKALAKEEAERVADNTNGL